MRSPRTLATVIIAVATYALALVATALLPWFTGREPAFAVLRAREREREATPELLQAIREQFDLPRTRGNRYPAGLRESPAVTLAPPGSTPHKVHGPKPHTA